MKTLVDGVAHGGDKPEGVLDLRSPERIARQQQKTIARPASPAGSLDGLVAQANVAAARQPTVPDTPAQKPARAPRPRRRLRFPAHPGWWRYGLIALIMAPVTLVGANAMLDQNSQPSVQAQIEAAISQNAPDPKTAAELPPPTDTTLQPVLDQFAAGQTATYSIWVKNLKTGHVASVGSDKVLTSASLYKLFVASEILKRVDAGSLSLTAAAGGGTNLTIQGCLKIMIDVSDNPCGRALGTKLGWGARNAALKEQGFVGTNLAQPQKTTAADVGRWFDQLYHGQLLGPASTELLLGWLKGQKVNNRLPKGLPLGTVIAHKTGDLDGYVHDGGIAYGPTNYVVVALSGPHKTPANAAAQFIKLSTQLWQHFNP